MTHNSAPRTVSRKKIPAKLRREWEAKLEESGLGNIEKVEYTPYLSNAQTKISKALKRFKGRERYFALAAQYLNDDDVARSLSPFDQWLWERHAEGLTTLSAFHLSDSAPKKGHPLETSPTTSYYAFKRRIRKLRNGFLTWVKQEQELDELDAQYAAFGGIDAYIRRTLTTKGRTS